jgi:hypothetical protein
MRVGFSYGLAGDAGDQYPDFAAWNLQQYAFLRDAARSSIEIILALAIKVLAPSSATLQP